MPGITVAADLVQIAVFPLFSEGILSPLNAGLDILVCGLLIVGWHIAFLPTFIIEQLPFCRPSPDLDLGGVDRHSGEKKAPREGRERDVDTLTLSHEGAWVRSLRNATISNNTEGAASPDDPKAQNRHNRFLDAVGHDVVGELPTLGHQFVLKLRCIGPRQVNLPRMPACFAKFGGSSGDTVLQGHGCIVPLSWR